jgi:hypothetical protein
LKNLLNLLFLGYLWLAPKAAVWAVGGMALAGFMEDAGVDRLNYHLIALAGVLLGIFSYWYTLRAEKQGR